MPFKQPGWVPNLQPETQIPDNISIPDFMFDEKYGRYSLVDSRPPFICGISGKALSTTDVRQQVDFLARGIAKELAWVVNEGLELDKVVCLFSFNTIDYVPLAWAIHSLGGAVTTANSQYSAADLVHQLRDSGAKAIFTCLPLLKSALQAAKSAGIPPTRVFLLNSPSRSAPDASIAKKQTTNGLVELGRSQPKLQRPAWSKGEGKRRIAFICYSSGTSGLPKGVMISHYNVIANTIQVCTFEQNSRNLRRKGPTDKAYLENVLGVLPMSHIYGLVLIAHCSTWRGDSVVVLPKFDFEQCLNTIQNHKINTLFLVPPVIILFTQRASALSKYDLSSVRAIFTGAAPLGRETAEALWKIFPNWIIRQGYGLTETCVVVSSSIETDIWLGSSGSLLPGVETRIVTTDCKEITSLDTSGELWVKSPSLTLGYLNNEKANRETFVLEEDGSRWLRTGDEAVFRKAPSGYEHLFIVDRIKELIKVKGLQVAPAELEAHLLRIPYVADCAVIGVPDVAAGEVPKAYVVKDASACGEKDDNSVRHEIMTDIKNYQSRHKWLNGGVEFIDAIPKSPSGKILRRLLRDKARQDGRKMQGKL